MKTQELFEHGVQHVRESLLGAGELKSLVYLHAPNGVIAMPFKGGDAEAESGRKAQVRLAILYLESVGHLSGIACIAEGHAAKYENFALHQVMPARLHPDRIRVATVAVWGPDLTRQSATFRISEADGKSELGDRVAEFEAAGVVMRHWLDDTISAIRGIR